MKRLLCAVGLPSLVFLTAICMEKEQEKNDGQKTPPKVNISPSSSIEFVPATLSSQQNNNNNNENNTLLMQTSDPKRRDSIGGTNNNSLGTNAGFGSSLSRIGSRNDSSLPLYTTTPNLFVLDQQVAEAIIENKRLRTDFNEFKETCKKDIDFLTMRQNAQTSKTLGDQLSEISMVIHEREQKRNVMFNYNGTLWYPKQATLQALSSLMIDRDNEIVNNEKTEKQPALHIAHLVHALQKEENLPLLIRPKKESKRTFIQKNAHKITTGLTIVSLFSLAANYFLGKKADISPLAWMPSLPSFVVRLFSRGTPA